MKQKEASIKAQYNESHPEWVRGLKPHIHAEEITDALSHPEWVRGLKLNGGEMNNQATGRTPSGCVD